MYASLLSPAERDADHPARGHLFPAFAVTADAPADQHHHRRWLGGLVFAVAAAALWLVR